ncbi:MAG: caspase family protein [Polyangiaceae bacterium]
MTDRALVIGLDAYDNPGWELRAAVRDALAFARWVTEGDAGRATPDTLTLLLSPHPKRPVKDVKFDQATEKTIRRALFDHKKNGGGFDRLWFFYAGHGLAPAGGGPDQAPVIVPSDATDLDFYRSNPIDLGSWIREMQVCAPEHQIFFVDACRGIVVSEDVATAMTTLFFDLSKVKPEAQARQAVLFATTAGQLANEQGLHGLFGGAVIDGLKGAGPKLEDDPETEKFVLRFGALAAYTKLRIQRQSDEARRRHQTLPTQEPAESLFRLDGSLELARFAEEPSSTVRVFVEPEEATKAGTAGIRTYNRWKKLWERQAEKPSPLGVPVVWDLSSTMYKIEIEAQGFENWAQKIDVIGPMEIHAELVKSVPSRPRGLESFFPVYGPEIGPKPPDGAELSAGKFGRLSVDAHDRYARIEVFDWSGTRVNAAWERLSASLPVGTYRVEVSLPTERPLVRSILVTADEPERMDVKPDPQLTDRLPAVAGMLSAHDGFSFPSEQFGVATTTHLGSILAWGAWAAQFHAGGDGRKLRALGIEKLPEGACFVRVLVGDARAPGPNPQGGPLETLMLEMPGQHVAMKPVPALLGFAEQWHAPVNCHTSITVQTGGLNPKRIPIPFVAEHVWTIVIVRESTQRTEIHRYLQRLSPQQPFDDTIRLVEQSWRAFEARAPLSDDEVPRLLARDLDPLALAVLGYRLAREQRWSEIGQLVHRIIAAGLTDGHVLAALAEPTQRDAHMQLAVSSPVPIIGEGYRAMEAWLLEKFEKDNLPPPIAPEPFTGGLWTTFDTRGQPVVSKAFPADAAPAWAKAVVAAASATVRVERASGELVGTGFLVGPNALATTDFIAELGPNVAVLNQLSLSIAEVVAATNDERHAALARLSAAVALPAPLKIRWEPPEVGTRIAVIGHPIFTFAPTLVTLAAFATQPSGAKMIMPGVITGVEERLLTYECWTMSGTAGGPIVDLATGEVIGIHHSGKYEGGAKKLGWGVPMRAIEELLRTSPTLLSPPFPDDSR